MSNVYQWFLTYPQFWATLSLTIVILLILALATVRAAIWLGDEIEAERAAFRYWRERAREGRIEDL